MDHETITTIGIVNIHHLITTLEEIEKKMYLVLVRTLRMYSLITFVSNIEQC